MLPAERRITIVGAGLVGSFLAICLKHKGYEVEIFEKRPDPRAGKGASAGRSINLIVTSRGLNALENAGLLPEVMKIVVPVYGRAIHSREGQIAFQPYGRDRSECNYSISRARLNEFLIDEAERIGVKIHFSKALSSLNLEQKMAQFEGGPLGGTVSIAYDLMLVAEGAGSVARHELVKALGPSEHEATTWLSADYKELLMPVETNQSVGLEPLDKNALHIWPRGSHMLMGLPNLDGSFTMTLYLPKRGGATSFEKVKRAADVRSLFESEFIDAAKRMPSYIDEFLDHPQGALGTVRTTKWVFKDSLALIGDAAHAIVPFFGQGMNLGFEDCTCLMRALENSGGDWAKALEHYDREQRPNANAIADMALENFIEMGDKAGRADFQLRKKIESAIESKYPDIYRSRYGMITYTLIPYALAQEAGRIQDTILDEICASTPEVAAINFAQAKHLIEQKLVPYMKANNLNIEKYRPKRG